jgi:hypothetical protein
MICAQKIPVMAFVTVSLRNESIAMIDGWCLTLSTRLVHAISLFALLAFSCVICALLTVFYVAFLAELNLTT